MPDLPKFTRRPLKVEPTAEEMLERLVRSLERIATGVESIVETINAVTTENASNQTCVRVLER